MKVWDDRYYSILIAVNGTTVTVLVDNKRAFTHTFAPRVIDGETYALNKGLIGVGSDNSRGYFDNITLQVLPPTVTLDATEDFTDGLAEWFDGESDGTWTTAAGRLAGTPSATELAYAELDLGIGRGLQSTAYLEIHATLRVGAIGGIIYDRYAPNDYKFVTLDTVAGRVVFGHVDPTRGLVTDQVVARILSAATDYTIQLTIKGLSISVIVNGGFVASRAYNGILVDGGFGLFSQAGTTSFDKVRVRTDDPAFPPGTTSTAAPAGATTSSTSSGSSSVSTMSVAAGTTVMDAEWVDDTIEPPPPAPEPSPEPAPEPTPAPEPEPILADGTYELDVRTTAVKPTSTWSDTGFVYLGEHTIEGYTGSLYAGINKATNMVEIGILTASGWMLLEQSSSALVKNTWYDVTVTTVDDLITVAVNSVVYLTYQVL